MFEYHGSINPSFVKVITYLTKKTNCRYEKNNRNYLLQNVAFALFGSPSSEGELTESLSGEEIKLEGYTSRQREQVMKVYEKLCEQSKAPNFFHKFLKYFSIFFAKVHYFSGRIRRSC